MRRLLLPLLGLYLGLALTGHLREHSGDLRCACRSDCWCKRRGLALFRWVFPFGHSVS